MAHSIHCCYQLKNWDVMFFKYLNLVRCGENQTTETGTGEPKASISKTALTTFSVLAVLL